MAKYQELLTDRGDGRYQIVPPDTRLAAELNKTQLPMPYLDLPRIPQDASARNKVLDEYFGPHISQGMLNLKEGAEGLGRLVGPQADILDFREYSGAAGEAWKKGNYGQALGNFGLAAATIPMMLLPGSVGQIRDVAGKATESFRSRLIPAIRGLQGDLSMTSPMTPEQARVGIRNYHEGVGEELKYNPKLLARLAPDQPPVTKAELLELAEENPLEIERVVYRAEDEIGDVDEIDNTWDVFDPATGDNYGTFTNEIEAQAFIDSDAGRELGLGGVHLDYDRVGQGWFDTATDPAKFAPKHSIYQTLGNSYDYEETVLYLPTVSRDVRAKLLKESRAIKREITEIETNPRSGAHYSFKKQELENRLTEIDKTLNNKEGAYISHTYTDHPNILVWHRANTRIIDGKKTRFIEEFQSDLHQKGRVKGYRGEPKKPQGKRLSEAEDNELNELTNRFNSDEVGPDAFAEQEHGRLQHLHQRREDWLNFDSGQEIRPGDESIPNVPYKKSWHRLALLDAARDAAKKGVDQIAWTSADAQLRRWPGEGEHVSSIAWRKLPNGKVEVSGTRPQYRGNLGGRGSSAATEQIIDPADLENIMDKEYADRIRNSLSDNAGTIEADTFIGGALFRSIYDRAMVRAASKLGVKPRRVWMPGTESALPEGAIPTRTAEETEGIIRAVDDLQGYIDDIFEEGVSQWNPDEARDTLNQVAEQMRHENVTIEEALDLILDPQNPGDMDLRGLVDDTIDEGLNIQIGQIDQVDQQFMVGEAEKAGRGSWIWVMDLPQELKDKLLRGVALSGAGLAVGIPALQDSTNPNQPEPM
jgi:hypothetical protein